MIITKWENDNTSCSGVKMEEAKATEKMGRGWGRRERLKIKVEVLITRNIQVKKKKKKDMGKGVQEKGIDSKGKVYKEIRLVEREKERIW